jgi:hypothetical protein
MLMRSGLTYSQASRNAKHTAELAYEQAIADGKTIEEAEAVAFYAYTQEMAWYES